MARYLSLSLDFLYCWLLAAVNCLLIGHAVASIECIILAVALAILYRVTDLLHES